LNNKIIILAAVGGISIATDASALPLSPFQSNNGVIEARWAEAYRPVAPRLEGRSVYMHDGYLYDPTTRRHYDRDRGRWVTDVGSVPIRD
jgi:hypothetical protein